DIKPSSSGIKVNLANLIIENVSGSAGSTSGIAANGASLTVKHCTVRGFGAGIGGGGISVALDDVVLSFNQAGVSFDIGTVEAIDTIAVQNGTGFEVGPEGTLFLAHSSAIGNTTGVDLSLVTVHAPRGTGTSFGDNHIKGNITDVKGGTLT